MAIVDSGPAGQPALEYPSFHIRFAAFCIDAPLRFARYLWSVIPFLDKAIVYVLWLLAAVIVPWLFTALQECSTPQATFGKRLLRVQVTDLDGRRISFGRASGRFFGRLIPTFGLGYLMALFTRRKQALHDLIAQCLVVRVPSDTVG